MKQMTVAEFNEWIHEYPDRVVSRTLSWKIKNNSRGVYDLIQATYPLELGQMVDGFDQQDEPMEKMWEFLMKKAEKSGNAAAYVQWVVASVPYIAEPDNWTKIVK